MRTHAAQHDDGEDDRRLDEGEGLRADQTLARGEEAAGETGEGGAQGEGRELDHGGVHAQRPADDLVLAQRFPGPADRHAQQAVDHEQGQQHQHQGDQVEEDHLVDRGIGHAEVLVEGLHALGGLAVEGQAEQGRLGDRADAVGAAGQPGHVVQQDADDLAETQSDDGQVVAAQAQHWEAEDKAEERRHQAGDRQADPEAQAEVERQQRIAVGTDGVEGHVTEVEQAGQTHHDVQAEAEHHVDQDQGGDVHRAAAAEERPGQGHDDQADDHPALGRGQGEEVAGLTWHARQLRCMAPGGAQLAAEQLPEEHGDRAAEYGPEHGRAGALDLQLDADGGEFQAHYRIGHGQHQQGAEDGGLEVVLDRGTHTFSTSGRPRMPVGRNSSTSTSRLNATTSLY
ncbi:hypothetical protein D3C84_638250 [compost metagenome]